MSSFLLDKFLIIPGILIVFTFHSYIRALIAYKLGDKSQKMQGNLSLDPFVHIDIIGFIMIVLAGFGWGKDTEVNKYAFKDSKKDNLKVSLAGLFSFLIVAIVAAIITIVCIYLGAVFNNAIMQIITTIFLETMEVAVNLFVFNLIPMPGLDMFRILEDVKPKWAYSILNFVSQYQILILLAIILLAGRVLSYPNMIVRNFVVRIASAIFGIF